MESRLRWRTHALFVGASCLALGATSLAFAADSSIFDFGPQHDLTWLYRTLAIALLIIVFSSAVAYRLSRLSAALRVSEERFRLVADNAQDVLWKYDLREQRLSYISPSIARLTGYTVEEAMAHSVDESFTLASAQAVREALANLAAHPEERKSVMELETIRKDGTKVWSEATMSFIRDASGKPSEVVGVSRDVTARRLAQEQQKRFLAMVSHEFRTPMNAILGIADLLAETELTQEQSKYVEVFRNAGNSLLDLINDILDLSKVEAGQFRLYLEDFALHQLLQAQIELLSGRAKDKGLTLELNIAADIPPFVHGDAQRLKQCITNLIGNAVKFCNVGGITLSVARQPDAQNMLQFSVRDTGIGIAADKLDSIFEAFTQADRGITRTYGGTGLGLTITQRLVELMEGRIWVVSTLGQGSTFHFTARLPEGAAPVVTHESLPASGATAKTCTRHLNILLAEDNPNNVFLMRSLLKHTPCQIDLADNGAIAVDKFRQGRYDLILMDVEMPVMDGYSATREIRLIEQQEGRQPTPIIALTAHALQDDEQKSFNAGCNRHLTKPIKKQTLLDALNALPPSRQETEPALEQPAQPGQPCHPGKPDYATPVIAALANNPQWNIQEALTRLEVEPELFLTVLGMFRDATATYAAEIADKLASGELQEARRHAHSLKGEAATVGAVTLSAAAAALEKAIVNGESQRYPELQEQVRQLSEQARIALLDLPPALS